LNLLHTGYTGVVTEAHQHRPPRPVKTLVLTDEAGEQHRFDEWERDEVYAVRRDVYRRLHPDEWADGLAWSEEQRLGNLFGRNVL